MVSTYLPTPNRYKSKSFHITDIQLLAFVNTKNQLAYAPDAFTRPYEFYPALRKKQVEPSLQLN